LEEQLFSFFGDNEISGKAFGQEVEMAGRVILIGDYRTRSELTFRGSSEHCAAFRWSQPFKKLRVKSGGYSGNAVCWHRNVSLRAEVIGGAARHAGRSIAGWVE
jgi:hypothetical protein